MASYIKLHRKMLQWGWYSDKNTKILFLHCLLKANWKPGEWHGIKYNSGEFITSLDSLSKETSLTISQVRTSLNHLILTGELTSKSQGKCRVITINNWNEYQEDSRDDDKIIARKSQNNRKEIATDKEYIEREEQKNIYIASFEEFWKHYPRKQEKGQAYKCYLARLKSGYSEDQLLLACQNYADECVRNKTEPRYIKHAKTFLSVNEPFVDYLKGNGNESERRTETDTFTGSAERDAECREIIRRIESGEADGDDDGLWD